ncbi:hypothetical protein E3E12_02185 [Formicincola oecophyllae]|uniref:YtxH domain-containing protein n=1 Tax=Formicincola oecophyllae TaxID=2558361 RepID=A0A4Y6U7B3_9PROT|nr:hypothetical protein [Formicincola oecophyllae]QDH13202.1 hypothetical protein E3E12_02185 [Formicincola oecophyllae]
MLRFLTLVFGIVATVMGGYGIYRYSRGGRKALDHDINEASDKVKAGVEHARENAHQLNSKVESAASDMAAKVKA